MPSLTSTYYHAASEGGGCCFDGSNIWTARQNAFVVTIQKFATDGTQLGSFTFDSPTSAVSPCSILALNGSLWIVNRSDNNLYQTNLVGVLLNTFAFDPVVTDTQQSAFGLCSDGIDIYIAYSAETNTPQQFIAVCQVTQLGVVNWTNIVNLGLSNEIFGPVFDGNNLWVSGVITNSVYILSTAGALIHTIAGFANNTAEIAYGGFVALLDFGRQWWKIDKATYALTGPFPIPSARFQLAIGLGLDSAQNVFVLDLGANLYVDVYNSGGVLIQSILTTLTDSGASVVYDNVSNRAWFPGAVDVQDVMLALGFGVPSKIPLRIPTQAIPALPLPACVIGFGIRCKY